MSSRCTSTIRALVALALVLVLRPAATARAQGQALDQQQLFYDSGTSARTLPGYTVWQTFTCGITGTLTQIDMGFFNDMSGDGTLEILEGEGTAGAVLQSLSVPVVGLTQPGVTWNAWTVSVPVVAGTRYTFNFTPNPATLPDPYGVAAGSGNPYAAGTMGIDDPSGSYPMPFDTVFRTWVSSGDPPPSLEVFRSASPDDVDLPAHVIATPSAPPHDDLAPPPDPLLFYEVDDGSGSPDVIVLQRLPGRGVRIDWR